MTPGSGLQWRAPWDVSKSVFSDPFIRTGLLFGARLAGAAFATVLSTSRGFAVWSTSSRLPSLTPFAEVDRLYGNSLAVFEPCLR